MSFLSAHATNREDFSRSVLKWFDKNGRKTLPWQNPVTPYRVWISEVMLQQTQVTTVIGYFEQFMERFPNVTNLATAPIDDVLYAWSGLGYYSRARNLHHSARIIVTDCQGELPQSVEALMQLPGIGRSTAGAIASIAMNIRAPILDGNVKRVLARYFAVDGWSGLSATAKQLWSLAEQLTPDVRFGDYTQAMMDLGSLVCTRVRPTCSQCPLEQGCKAHRLGREIDFPQPKPKKAKQVRTTRMLLVTTPSGEVLLEKRPDRGIWGGLWSFPECPVDHPLQESAEKQTGVTLGEPEQWAVFRHSFTHYHLEITPVRLLATGKTAVHGGNRQWFTLEAAARLGLPAPVTKLLHRIKQSAHYTHTAVIPAKRE